MASKAEETDPYDFEKWTHTHIGWNCCLDNMILMAERLQAGECVHIRYRDIEGTPRWLMDRHDTSAYAFKEWCLTHAVKADYGHVLSLTYARKGSDVPSDHS